MTVVYCLSCYSDEKVMCIVIYMLLNKYKIEKLEFYTYNKNVVDYIILLIG